MLNKLFLLCIFLFFLTTFVASAETSNALDNSKPKSNFNDDDNNDSQIANNIKTLSKKDKLKQDVDFKAKRIYYDFKSSTTTATGAVIFKSGTRELYADQVSYNVKDDVLYAKGNVVLIDENHNIIKAKEIILDAELQKGFITDFKTIFADKSILIAESVERKNNTSYNLKNMCYTSCHIVKDSLPTWSLNASSAIYNEVDSKITLYNVWFDFYNIPFLWSPYFTFSNLSLERKAGLLVPQLSSNSTYGSYIEQPLYMPLGEHQDATLTTDLYLNHSPLYLLAYNGFINQGNFKIKAGYVEDTPKENKWHILGYMQKELSAIWRVDAQIEQVNDVSYLNMYGIDDKDSAESFFEDHIIFEGFFNQNNYLSFSWENYDNVNNIFENKEHPYTYNTVTGINYNYYGDYTKFGRININSAVENFLTSFDDSVYRIGLDLSYKYVKPTSLGNYSVDILSETVTYQANANSSQITDNFAGQIAAATTWDYLWIYNKNNFVYSFGPIAQALVSNVISANNNEMLFDSYNENITANNLFDINHYSGYDNFTDRDNLKYALQANILNENDLGSRLFIGQMFSYGNDSLNDSGYDSTNIFATSNYFISWYIYPYKSTYIIFDSILTPDFTIQESSLSLGYRNQLFNIGGTYYKYNTLDPKIFSETEQSEFSNYLRFNLTKQLYLAGSTLFNTTKNQTELKEVDFTLTWANECIEIEAYVTRDIYEDSSNSYGIKLNIRGLDNYNFGI